MNAPKKDWELAELVAFMKAQGVTKVKLGGLEVELSPMALSAPAPGAIPAASGIAMPTPEEFMLWSAQDAFEEPSKGSN
jgi:hypothetical protein